MGMSKLSKLSLKEWLSDDSNLEGLVKHIRNKSMKQKQTFDSKRELMDYLKASEDNWVQWTWSGIQPGRIALEHMIDGVLFNEKGQEEILSDFYEYKKHNFIKEKTMKKKMNLAEALEWMIENRGEFVKDEMGRSFTIYKGNTSVELREISRSVTYPYIIVQRGGYGDLYANSYGLESFIKSKHFTIAEEPELTLTEAFDALEENVCPATKPAIQRIRKELEK